MAYELLAKEQPMAIDLRFILSVIKINGDLERIGDQSMGIARRTKEILKADEVDLPVDFAAMGEFAGRMIRSAVQALLEGDAHLADSVREMDDEIDRMNRRAHADLLKLIQEKPQFTQQSMNGILVARNLERIADHASNIATDVIFWIRARMSATSSACQWTDSRRWPDQARGCCRFMRGSRWIARRMSPAQWERILGPSQSRSNSLRASGRLIR